MIIKKNLVVATTSINSSLVKILQLSLSLSLASCINTCLVMSYEYLKVEFSRPMLCCKGHCRRGKNSELEKARICSFLLSKVVGKEGEKFYQEFPSRAYWDLL